MLKKIFASIKEKQLNLQGILQKRWEAGAGGSNHRPLIVEDDLAVSLRTKFPKASFIQVNDVSGGCGAMFEVSIESSDFKGLSIVKQHRLVTTALQDQIKSMHGIRIQTAVPSEN